MNKAEDRALEKYPKKIEWVGNQWDGAPFDVNSERRVAYKQGYNQAEKDLELTWEDVKEICDIAFEEACRLQRNMKSSLIYKEQHYQETLKRFKERKENAKVNV